MFSLSFSETNVTLPLATLRNGSLYLHVFLGPQGKSLTQSSQHQRISIITVPVTKYLVPSVAEFNLVTGEYEVSLQIIHSSIIPSIYLFICLSIYISIHPSFHLYISIHLSIHLYIHSSIIPYFNAFINLFSSLYQTTNRLLPLLTGYLNLVSMVLEKIGTLTPDSSHLNYGLPTHYSKLC